jgi:hypothetical protein
MRHRYYLTLPSIKPLGSVKDNRFLIVTALKRNNEKPVRFRELRLTRAQIMNAVKSSSESLRCAVEKAILTAQIF